MGWARDRLLWAAVVAASSGHSCKGGDVERSVISKPHSRGLVRTLSPKVPGLQEDRQHWGPWQRAGSLIYGVASASCS